jgi:hypothetical protein
VNSECTLLLEGYSANSTYSMLNCIGNVLSVCVGGGGAACSVFRIRSNCSYFYAIDSGVSFSVILLVIPEYLY